MRAAVRISIKVDARHLGSKSEPACPDVPQMEEEKWRITENSAELQIREKHF